MYSVVDAEGPLQAAMAAHASRAAAAGRKPFVMISADWAPPCARFFSGLEGPQGDVLRAALQGVDLLVVDVASEELPAVGLDGSSFPAFVGLDAAGRPDGRGVTGAAWDEDTPLAMAHVLGPFFHDDAAPVTPPGTTFPVSPRVRAAPAPAMRAMDDEPAGPSYEAWIRSVLKSPLGSGWAGVGLTLTTLAALIAAFVFLHRPVLGALPDGRYPRILLALPFLLVAGVVFLVLSPLFYALQRRSAPAAPRPYDAGREMRASLIQTALVMLALGAGVLVFILWLKKNTY